MDEQSAKPVESNQASGSLLNALITPYRSHAAALPGHKISRECITLDVIGADLSYYHFQDIEAKGLKFSKCKFQHCVFERCYFRNVTFEDCDFIGARFIDSNLRGAILITCKIEYTFYRATVLDRAQFAANLPLWENVRAEVARSLRTNAHGLGDSEGVNYFINVEMDGTLEHWWKAFRQKESYYKKKYPGVRRFQAFGRYVYYRLDRLAWGHGERPMRILRNILLLLCYTMRRRRFWDRVWLERTVLTVVNTADECSVPLVGLSHAAVERWQIENRISSDSRVVAQLKEISRKGELLVDCSRDVFDEEEIELKGPLELEIESLRDELTRNDSRA